MYSGAPYDSWEQADEAAWAGLRAARGRPAALSGETVGGMPPGRVEEEMADIVRRDPFDGLGLPGLRQMMDRLFDDSFFRSPTFGTWDEGTLAVDISEADHELVVRASLPGFKKEEIEVQVDEGVLSINAKHSEEKEEKGETFYRRERRSGSVSRRIALPGVIHDAPVDATLADGVLTLRLKVPEAARPKQIEIKTT